MRNQLGTLLCLVMALSPVSKLTAQVNFGPLGGLNLSNLKNSPQDFSTRTGFSGGVLLNPQFNRWLGLQLEGYYTQKGGNGFDDTPPVAFDTSASEIHLDYFEAPLLVRLTTPGETARGFIHFGTAVAARLKCTVVLYTTGQLVPTKQCDDIQGEPFVKGVDWSFAAGAGFDVRAGGVAFGEPGQAITLEFRFLNGFRPVGQTAPKVLNPAKNRVYAFSVKYPIGR